MKLSLYVTNQALGHDDVWGSGYIDSLLFTSALFVFERSATRLDSITTDTHLIGCVGPRTGLKGVERRNILPYRDSNYERSVVQLVANYCTESDIPAVRITLK
jgi:hypothetical protein